MRMVLKIVHLLIGNAMKETQGGAVRAAGSCAWINNIQAFLATESEPARSGVSALFSELED